MSGVSHWDGRFGLLALRVPLHSRMQAQGQEGGFCIDPAQVGM
jgi:hypothetical protein